MTKMLMKNFKQPQFLGINLLTLKLAEDLALNEITNLGKYISYLLLTWFNLVIES